MEDGHIVDFKFDDEDTYLFAVFDGHGGSLFIIESLNIGQEVARYAAEHFCQVLKEDCNFK